MIKKMLIVIFVFFFQIGSIFAYDLMIDVKEDKIELKPISKDVPGAWVQQDVTVEIEARNLAGAPWRLFITAEEDMNGPESIPASRVTWDALNTPFINGRLVKGIPQLVAQGTGNIHTFGRLRFTADTGDYEGGNYDLNVRFIFSSP